MIPCSRFLLRGLAGAWFFCAAGAFAQQGDKQGETQATRVPREKIPAAPPLPPAEAQRQFQLQPGFRIELVASEPMVENPIVLQFDPEGRLWVLEMRGFMPNPEGQGETNRVGRISILEDVDGDGRMDRRTIFLEGLVMPRAMLLVKGGLLVCEPPQLWFYPNEQDRPGARVLVASDFAREADPSLGLRMNVEHSGNSLVRNLDNWIYSLYHPYRYRFRDGRWHREPMPQRVQWGLAQDDFGRLFYTSNSDQLRGDLVPSHYYLGKMGGAKLPGIGLQIAADQTVWPIRVNPGVNRGYQPDTLRPDGTLLKFTAACGPTIYRGDAFPPGFYGNAFVCEPAANLVRRNLLADQDGIVTARNAYSNAEFLASKDELFRPVNLANGPDGALYIADMYHGIIQHRAYLTSYLRAQAEDRGLEMVTDKGRIWRVVPADGLRRAHPRLSTASSAELVQALAHANGWWRDTAQRLLVDRGDPGALGLLQKLAASEAGPVARLHALWTMEGFGQLPLPLLESTLNDPSPKVRATGIRLAEGFVRNATNQAAGARLKERIIQLAGDAAADVRIQTALTLGLLLPDPPSKAALALMARDETAPLAREIAGFQLASLDVVRTDPATAPKGRPLNEEEKRRFEAGKSLYEATCLACHQVHGMGQAGLAPPLLGSEWVAGADDRIIRIVLNGLRGPIKVKGESFELDMPALGVLDDDQIASVLTYVRREWTHAFEPVAPAKVKAVRAATASREDAWTMVDLLKIP